MLYLRKRHIEYSSYLVGNFSPKMLTERIGEVTRFELSSVTIRDIGSFTDMTFIGVQTEQRMTTSPKTATNTIANGLNVKP